MRRPGAVWRWMCGRPGSLNREHRHRDEDLLGEGSSSDMSAAALSAAEAGVGKCPQHRHVGTQADHTNTREVGVQTSQLDVAELDGVLCNEAEQEPKQVVQPLDAAQGGTLECQAQIFSTQGTQVGDGQSSQADTFPLVVADYLGDSDRGDELVSITPVLQRQERAEDSEREQSGPEDLSNAWINAENAISELDTYVRYFCRGFCLKMARQLATDGNELLVGHGSTDVFDDSTISEAVIDAVAVDPCRAASAIVWTLMEKALESGQGFVQGTFVVHGPAVEHVFWALLPHTYDRRSSHFSNIVIPVCSDDISRMPAGPLRVEVEERALLSSCHIGIDVRQDGIHDLPAGKQHVLLGRIRNHDGSVAIYVKPEDHGCRMSTETVAEAARHAAQFVDSQLQRVFFDRRQHDEGALKRKEHMSVQDRKKFDDLVEALKTPLEQLDESAIGAYGLGEMVRYLRRADSSLAEWRSCAQALLAHWETAYGASLELRHGREVIIHSSELSKHAEA